jgi:hypothetical protein
LTQVFHQALDVVRRERDQHLYLDLPIASQVGLLYSSGRPELSEGRLDRPLPAPEGGLSSGYLAILLDLTHSSSLSALTMDGRLVLQNTPCRGQLRHAHRLTM